MTNEIPSDTFSVGQPKRGGPIRSLALRIEPIARPLAGTRIFPLWAILHHAGRRSGTPYATPVVALRTNGGFVIPLPFGDATQWAKNLFAAGGATLRWSGRDWSIRDPELIDLEAARPALGPVIGAVAARLGLRDYVRVRQD
jgi:deazaflavin-dependent oxidoreductase (nitroreductase family)